MAYGKGVAYADYDNDGKIDVYRNGTDIDGDLDNENKIVQAKNYYPFGLQIQHGANNALSIVNGRNHKYGITGKEYNDELNLDWYDFGARNYDAALGRWMNLDPLSEQYESYSPYNNTLNNPVYFIDPDGKKIIIHYKDTKGNDQTLVYQYGDKYEGDNQFLKDVFASFDYLINNELGDVIKDVAGKKESVNLKEGATLNDLYYDPNTNNLIYHPRSGLKTSDGGKQSPALGLLHELGHAQGDLTSPDTQRVRAKVSHSKFGNLEEKRVIEDIENPAAKKLGEGTRSDHGGTPYTTVSPTTTMSVQTESENQAFKDHKKAQHKQKSISTNNN